MRTGSRCEYGLCDSESMCKMCQKRGYGSGPHVADADIVPWLRLEADAAAHQPSPWMMLAAAANAIERLTAERDEAVKECNRLTQRNNMLINELSERGRVFTPEQLKAAIVKALYETEG
jgi:hypothetical protein